MIFRTFIILLLSLCTLGIASNQGSAIVTLSLPVGARQLGMGETGTALPEDAFATYWNPAGLAFAPLGNEWKLSYPQKDELNQSSYLTSNIKSGFFQQSELWMGGPNGLLHFNGSEWVDYHIQEIFLGNNLRGLVRKFIGTNNDITPILMKVKEYNEIFTAEEERLVTKVKLPWSLVIKDSITVLTYDTDKKYLWVGTTAGLYRFDGTEWKSYDTSLGKVRVTALSLSKHTVWIGTTDGLYKLHYNALKRVGKVLPTQHITALAYSPVRKELYAAVKEGGIARLTETPVVENNVQTLKSTWNVYTLDDGLIDLNAHTIVVDSLGEVWVAHTGGVSRFTLKKWEQILFENNRVNTITNGPLNSIWIGTDKGVWEHFPRRFLEKKKSLLKTDKKGEWKHYHVDNGLHSNKVYTILSQDKELWLITGAGVEHFKTSELQVSFFYEWLLESLGIKDLWHIYSSTTIPMGDWGTIGVFAHYASLGKTENHDDHGDLLSEKRNGESVGGISYGTKLTAWTSLGLNFKFFYSDLSSGNTPSGKETTASYAIDISYLAKNVLFEKLNFGLGLFNIGPSVYYTDNKSTDPIPLTWRFGTSYEILNFGEHKLLAAMDYDRLALSGSSDGESDPFYISAWKAWFYPDQGSLDAQNDGTWDTFKKSMKEGIFKVGAEYTYMNMFALRGGYMVDPSGDREEYDIGVGVMISTIFQLDYAQIGDLSGNNVRDGQRRYSMLLRF